MCGIAGIVNFDGEPVSPEILKKMTDIMVHRGPDDEGHHIDGPVGLGHRRLSIIDLSHAGHQPMHSSDARYTITYNGEVYNYRELRAELESKGHRFTSQTDTEVVLYAYIEWGQECVDRFNGMFAFAIWDKHDRRLFLARDRYGIKPLYYCLKNGLFLFASEIKAMLQHPVMAVDVDPHALLEYFTFQNIFTDRTLFKDIRLLPAGHRATLSVADSNSMSIGKYWDFDFREPDPPGDMREYEEELDRLFCRAVIRQLVSDVPVGAYLSGGLDSGAITAVAAGEIPYLTSVTCGFDLSSASGLELGFDERERAEALSYRFKTEHYEAVLKAGDMERVMGDLVRHLEDLRIGQCYPNYYAARLASKFVKVVLSGAGGDELFAGYPWRYYRAAANQSFGDYMAKYYTYWQRLVPDDVVGEFFDPAMQRAVGNTSPFDIFCNVISHNRQDLASPAEYVNRSLYFEAKTFLHGVLLVEDKLSMAHGLETRVPFLDNDLVDFSMRIPIRAKLRELDRVVHVDENEPGRKVERYLGKTNDGKLILRRVMGRRMPGEYVNGIKQGFSGPDASWFRGDSIDYVRKLLYDDNAQIYDYLRRDTVVGLVKQHLDGQQNRRLLIWSLLCFEWWLRTFKG